MKSGIRCDCIFNDTEPLCLVFSPAVHPRVELFYRYHVSVAYRLHRIVIGSAVEVAAEYTHYETDAVVLVGNDDVREHGVSMVAAGAHESHDRKFFGMGLIVYEISKDASIVAVDYHGACSAYRAGFEFGTEGFCKCIEDRKR